MIIEVGISHYKLLSSDRGSDPYLDLPDMLLVTRSKDERLNPLEVNRI